VHEYRYDSRSKEIVHFKPIVKIMDSAANCTRSAGVVKVITAYIRRDNQCRHGFRSKYFRFFNI
jgi:hypothetical protein